MSRYYTPEECRRKADQHWDMAGLARQDRDYIDAEKHTRMARVWDARVVDGGFEEKSEK